MARFKSVRQALSWALSTAARDGYVSLSQDSMLGGGRTTGTKMTILEQHGDAAFILATIDELPEFDRSILWIRTGLLPEKDVRMLAARAADLWPDPAVSREVVCSAILKTAGFGPNVHWFSKHLKCHNDKASSLLKGFGLSLQGFAANTEIQVRQKMIEKGWVE